MTTFPVRLTIWASAGGRAVAGGPIASTFPSRTTRIPFLIAAFPEPSMIVAPTNAFAPTFAIVGREVLEKVSSSKAARTGIHPKIIFMSASRRMGVNDRANATSDLSEISEFLLINPSRAKLGLFSLTSRHTWSHYGCLLITMEVIS